MRNKRSVVRITVLVIVLCFVYFSYRYFFLGKGEDNLRVCRELKEGTSRNEIIHKLGNPFRIEETERGEMLYFESKKFAAGPIRILVDEKSNKVIGKKCDEDVEWVYFSLAPKVKSSLNK